MKRRDFLRTTLAAAAAGALTACGASTSQTTKTAVPEFVFTYAENQASDYPTSLGAEYFADLVYKRTDGRIKINIYANSVSGDEPSVLEQLQYGGIDFARVSVMIMANDAPALNVLQLPYLYKDSAHKWRVLDGEIGKELLAQLSDYDVIGLSWYDAGERHLYNRIRRIEKLEDLAGLRIRVAESDFMTGLVTALGATPVTVAFAEVRSALETRQIDGAENNWPSYESKEHWQVAPFITLDAHNSIPELQLCSANTWSQLSEEDHNIIRQCAEESALYQRKLWAQVEKEAREKIEDACIITELSEEELARFRKATQPLYEQYAADYADLVERIRAEGEVT